MEVFHETEQQFQNMLDSSFQPNFQELYPSFSSPIQNEQPSVLELSMKLLRESKRYSQNMLDSPFFQNQASHTSFLEHPTVKKSILKMSMEALRESEQQSQNLMDSRFNHNFQNQLLYSHFQEEPIEKIIEDMIQTRNSVTRPISRFDSIMSESINSSEKSLSCELEHGLLGRLQRV